MNLHTKALHTDAFTQEGFYTQSSFYTQKLVHKTAFTHGSFYTGQPLRRAAFTHRSICTEGTLYTQKLLPFTHGRIDTHTETLLHTDTFTQSSFLQLLDTEEFI